MPLERTAPDLLRRFTPTPLETNLSVMGRTVRLESNSRIVLDQARQAFECYGGPSADEPQFLWRLVSETDSPLKLPWPQFTGFSDQRLSVVNIGQHSFLAADLDAREGVGFLAEEFVKDEVGFCAEFLATLFSATAPALGLTPFCAACVGFGDTGLLILGPPKSGKTTSAYLSPKLDLRFVADQIVFLEATGESLRGWGEFWPASFYADAREFLPEIRPIALAFYGPEGTRLCVAKTAIPGSAAQAAHSVTPAGCIFLERGHTGPTQLDSLGSLEFVSMLNDMFPFKGDSKARSQFEAVCQALARLPAHRLSYGIDPLEAVPFFAALLGAAAPAPSSLTGERPS